MNLCIVPEDHRDDQYIVKPLFEKLLRESDKVPGGKPQVRLYQRTAGIDQIQSKLSDVALRYGHYDAIVVAVDRDCEESRRQSVEEWIDRSDLREVRALTIPCIAVQEVEIWLLGLYDDRLDPYWKDVRSECSLKEFFFHDFLASYGDERAPGGGRKRLMKQGLEEASLSSLLQKCEELQECLDRIEALFE